jgi:hypothetical protein
MQLSRPHLSKLRRWEALWEKINIQQQILGPDEYLLMFIKIMGKWFES